MGIIVEWIRPAVPGTEYIDDIDLDNLDRFLNHLFEMKTKFWFPGRMGEGGEFVECVAEIRAERRAADRVDLVIEYHKHLNQKGVDLGLLSEGSWGTNRIFIKKGQDYGDYRWKGENAFKFRFSKHSDKAGWRKDDLYEKKDHHVYRRKYRKAIFRSLIVAFDNKKCVISGENTEKALDAAHIIRAADGGAETRKNGVTLRTDIHRLYDAGMFLIDPKSGQPVIIDESNDQLSDEYKKLLKESKGLPPETRKRVKEALEKAWKHDRSRV